MQKGEKIMNRNDNDLCTRLFNFAVNVIKFLKLCRDSSEMKVVKYQLTKASTSSGANYEESQAGVSRADFTNKVSIALKEMRESNYWLRIIKFTEIYPPEMLPKLEELIQESKELKNILGSIVVNSSKNK